MTRVARTRLLVLLFAVLLSAGIVEAAAASGFHPAAMIGLPACFLILRWIQRRQLRDFFQGRRLLSAGQPQAALESFRRCQAVLQAEPWRRRWFMLVSVYTPNADAMLLHHIGMAHLYLGNLAEAESAFREALAVDPLYPLPWVTLAVLEVIRGNRDAAATHLAEARRLGYAGATLDWVSRKAQSLAARVDGREGATGS